MTNMPDRVYLRITGGGVTMPSGKPYTTVVGDDRPQERHIEYVRRDFAAAEIAALREQYLQSQTDLQNAIGDRDEAIKQQIRAEARAEPAERKLAEAREALRRLADAKVLSGIRKLVAGWNGEDRPGGPFNERHPDKLGATLPKTTCGAVYELDEALTAARAIMEE